MTNDDLKRFYEINKNSEFKKDFARYDDNGNIKVSDNPSNKDAINKDTAENIISKINSIKIRNKKPNLVINVTTTNFEEIATKYIVDNYERQPEEYDGLYLTFTDRENQVVKYAYHNNAWVNSGFDKVDLSNYMDLITEQHVRGRKVFEDETEFNGQVDYNDIIRLNDSEIITSDTNTDSVIKYGATGINIEKNGDTKQYWQQFQNDSGFIALLEQTINKILKHSEFKNRDLNNQKEDTWITDDANSVLSMTHENTTTAATMSVQKGYVEMSVSDIGENPSNSGIITTSNSVIISSRTEDKNINLTITSDNAQINGKDVLTETELEKKLDKVETPSSFVKLYGIQKDGSQTLVNIDEQTDSNSTNPVQNKVVTNALKDKLNVFAPGESNRVYVRKENNLDSSLPYTYTAEGDSIVYRNAYGRTQVEDPTQPKDAVNKEYADSLQRYISLTGESGILEDDQYNTVKEYDNLIIQRAGIDFRRSGYPSNGQGDYVFTSTYYAKPNGTEEFDAYIITIKQDKTWTFTLKNFLMIGEQTYAPFVEINPSSATNGNLSDDDFENLTEHDDVYIILNNEYYYKADNGHTPGILSYTHTGWNGNAPQDKSINITLATKAWTLVIGQTRYYRHYICLEADGKTLYYDFSSTQSTAYTSSTLPAMPDDIITAIQVVAGGYYSSVSGLVYRNGQGELKVIVHGMYTTDGTSMTYLQLTGNSATFVKDTVTTL